MTLSGVFLFGFALFLTALAPGSIVIAMTSRIITRGLRDVLPFILAMWLGELIWLTAALAGLSVLAATFQEVFTVLKYAGVCYLLWLAWRTWNSSPADEEAELPNRNSTLGMFAGGLTLSLSSPEIMVFYLALLPTFVDLQIVTFKIWALFVLVALVAIVTADLFWIGVSMTGRRMLKTRRAIKVMNRMSAGAIATAAGIVATR